MPNDARSGRATAGALGAGGYADWPHQYGWWPDKREPTLRRLRGG
jgi:hypothetical protein